MYYHTSPSEIKEIYESELFGYGLFFAAKPYFMSAESDYIYSIDESKLKVLNLKSMQYRIIVEDEPVCQAFAERWGLSLEDAANLISEETPAADLLDCSKAGEASWEAQGAALKIAVNNGYDAVGGYDEQGYYLLVDARRVQMTLVEDEEDEE